MKTEKQVMVDESDLVQEVDVMVLSPAGGKPRRIIAMHGGFIGREDKCLYLVNPRTYGGNMEAAKAGAERVARNKNATHDRCSSCGQVKRVGSICIPCADMRMEERRKKEPAVVWDGRSPIYSHVVDEYAGGGMLYEPGDVMDIYLEREGCYVEDDDGNEHLAPEFTEMKLEDLQWVLCDPQIPRFHDDQFGDLLPEDADGEYPDWLVNAMNVFDDLVSGRALSWLPGKTRVVFSDETA